MADITIRNANDPAYWQEVRHNAAHRKALAEVKEGFAETDCGMIYEAWVADLMDLVRQAAHNAGILADATRYQALREDCAAFMQLPEIASADHKQLSRDAFAAIDAAAEALYGQQGA